MDRLKRTLIIMGVMTALGVLLAIPGMRRGMSTEESPNPPSSLHESVLPEADKIRKSGEQWRAELAPEAYRVLRERGTERAYTGAYHDFKGDGLYRCAACGHVLFDSRTKFDSGTGWPSFYEPAGPRAVDTLEDRSLLLTRTEVVCARCDSHLGHVFADGPPPTGRRYCINSVALTFEARAEE